MKHLLSIEAMDAKSIETILENAGVMKAQRGDSQHQPLAGQTWAMIFAKSSTRTRVSFEVGIRELGGSVMFLSANDLQLGRGEPLKDTARVLGRMVHGAVIRTFAQSDVEEFAEHSGIPTINALTDAEHPCQILTDIFTYQELRGPIAGKVVTYIGDGACNVPISWIWAAGKLDFQLRIAAPQAHQPSRRSHRKSRRQHHRHRRLQRRRRRRRFIIHRRLGLNGQRNRSRPTRARLRQLPNQRAL